MARNKYDADEVLQSEFNIKHFARAIVYAKKHAKMMILALVCSIISALSALMYPLILEHAFNVTIPGKNFPQLLWLTALVIGTILLSIAMNTARSRIMAKVGQAVIYEMRKDLFVILSVAPSHTDGNCRLTLEHFI